MSARSYDFSALSCPPAQSGECDDSSDQGVGREQRRSSGALHKACKWFPED